MVDLREKWDGRYEAAVISEESTSRVLLENLHLLPQRGRALDLACGLGANALRLARAGLQTDAWDLSPVAIGKLHQYAEAHGLPLQYEVRDVIALPPAPESYDVIVVSHFLERSLCPILLAALRPEGLLFYQTFAGTGSGPSNPTFRLAPNELLRLFAGLELLVYREEGESGDLDQGFRGQALLVGRKA
jgi:2-polyprenyl-3-methyl-5-hydroxy-6-metoxy-1,4-benzoquinol methylase